MGSKPLFYLDCMKDQARIALLATREWGYNWKTKGDWSYNWNPDRTLLSLNLNQKEMGLAKVSGSLGILRQNRMSWKLKELYNIIGWDNDLSSRQRKSNLLAGGMATDGLTDLEGGKRHTIIRNFLHKRFQQLHQEKENAPKILFAQG